MTNDEDLIALARRLPELVNAGPPPDAAEIVRRSTIGDVRPLRRPWYTRAPVWLSTAAAASIILAAGAYFAGQSAATQDATGLGLRDMVTSQTETTTLELLDGTVIRLAPSSRLRTIGGAAAREVSLEGRAYFAVAKQNGRPFIIRTPAGAVTVLGTRFDVEARGENMRLVVVEGRVAVTAASTGQRTELTAGEMSRITNGEVAPVERVPDVGPLVQWTGRFLAFQHTPLRDAAREIERVYGVRVEISDDTLASRVLTAWFRDESLNEVVEVVCLAVAARCTIDGGVVRIQPERRP